MLFPSLLAAIDAHAKQTPDKLCLADAYGEVTYVQFAQRILSTRNFLLSQGVKKGDRIVLKAAQSITYLVWCHAAQLAKAIPVPLETNAGDKRIEEILATTEASFYIGEKSIGAAILIPYDAQETLAMEGSDIAPFFPTPEDESMILFTTGTTGSSKGIVITYTSEVAVAENVMYGVDMREDNVEIIPTPMNHSFSLRRYYANMIRGASVVLLEGVVFLKQFYAALDQYRATAVALVPSALSVILKLSGSQLSRYNQQLHYVQFGSAPIPEADKEKLLRLLPDCRLYNIYGSTESGCSCCLNFNSEDNKASCIGFPTKHAHFIVVDAEKRPIHSSYENQGFLAYTGAMAMTGYYNEPQLTEDTIQEGYLYTKDKGYIDSEGRVYMMGRDDDVISTGGNKVSPIEVEEWARRYEGVEDCICGAAPDAVMGSVPILYIVAKADLDLQSLLQYLSLHLEGFKVPKKISLIDEVPRTYNGKVWRAKFSQIPTRTGHQ